MTTMFSRDAQLKTMEATISNAEKYMGQFCMLLAAYTRKTAKLRDKADLLARQLHDFACTEDPELSICLKNLSEDLAMVQDYRQAEVERLDTRVVTPLKAYGDLVKTKRAELKKFSADHSSELKELQRLEKIRLKNPADRQSIAEVNVQKASSNANRSTRQMEDTIIDFQRQKLEDVKRIFMEFIMVEMLFHSKALEVFSHTFKIMESMDIDKDVELFRNRIQVSGSPLENTASTVDMTQYPSTPTSTLRLPQYPSPPASTRRLHQYPSPLASTRRLHQYPSPPPSIPRMTLEQPRQTLSRTLHRQREMDDEEEEERYGSEEDVEEPQAIRQSYAAEYVRSHRQK